MARSPVTPLSVARGLVFRTGSWPLLGDAYRGVYRLQLARARRALASLDGVGAVLLRGSDPRSVNPGLSDIDLVVVPAPGLRGEARLAFHEELYRRLDGINRGAPLLRDVHVVTREALHVLGAAASGFHAVTFHDATPLVGSYAPAPPSRDPLLIREMLLREVFYWAQTTLRKSAETDAIGCALAARSYAKTTAALSLLTGGASDVAALARAYAAKELVTPTPRRLLDVLVRAERELPDAPAVPALPPEPHPAVEAQLGATRGALGALVRHPSVESVLLSVEGPRENDLRAYVVVDPTHAAAEGALALSARVALERTLPRAPFSRFAEPLVVTRRILARSVFLRFTAFEPAARAPHARALAGPMVPAEATSGEQRRAVALELATAQIRASELVARPPSLRGESELADVAWGLLPAARELARSGTFHTTGDSSAPRDPAERRAAILSRAFRAELLDALDASVTHDAPRLLTEAFPA